MSILRSILGGLAGAIVATSVMAEPTLRPLSRTDAALLRQAAETAALASSRVMARPTHMVRYPVVIERRAPDVRPLARPGFLPNTRWDHKRGSDVWTRAAMSAIVNHGDGLDEIVPRDIKTWCPAYARNSKTQRAAFWVGMMSALAKYESTYNPNAVGGGNLWYGLLQIYPDTAQRYGCRAKTGEALKNPVENLSCAARIMNVTVRRDNAVAVRDTRWRGVAADWGPMTNRNKIASMAAWTAKQDYCQPKTTLRPQLRPEWNVTVSTKGGA